jgi:nucleotide-binding universal stress UspA family protein
MESIKILVPTDFSECAKNALKYAIHLSQQMKSELTIMHGYHIPIPSAEMTVSADPEITENYRKEVELQVEELKEEIKELDSIPSDFKFVMAFAVEAILQSLGNTGADLIIMGTKGASGMQKLFGSITSSIIQKSPKPVLAIPEDFKDFKLSKIGIAVDLNEVEDYHILTLVKLIAVLNDAEVHIISVSKDTPEPDQMIELKKVEHFLEKIPNRYQIIKGKDIDESITDYIEENDIDLLTMIHRHHSLFESLFRKSITRSMSRHAKIPLLVIPE